MLKNYVIDRIPYILAPMEVCTESVMLIDDNEIDIFINKRLLEFNNFSRNILSACSGREALELLKNNQNLPDVIFLDLNMPVIDGFRFLKELTTLPDGVKGSVQVVVLSSSENKKDIRRASSNPVVVEYIAKPLTHEKIKDLRNLLVSKAMHKRMPL
jgi:CheY-like chemotaxis protein